MGLIFTVGTPADVFFGDFAVQVEQELAMRFNYSAQSQLSGDPYRSEEVEWFGWAQLQQMAGAAIGRPSAPNLLSVDAWRGVFLPMAIEPVSLEIDEDAWLQCASLPGLLGELEQLAAASLISTDPANLKRLWDKYNGDMDADEGTEMMTFSQTLLAAQVAVQRGLPLWVVK